MNSGGAEGRIRLDLLGLYQTLSPSEKEILLYLLIQERRGIIDTRNHTRSQALESLQPVSVDKANQTCKIEEETERLLLGNSLVSFMGYDGSIAKSPSLYFDLTSPVLASSQNATTSLAACFPEENSKACPISPLDLTPTATSLEKFGGLNDLASAAAAMASDRTVEYSRLRARRDDELSSKWSLNPVVPSHQAAAHASATGTCPVLTSSGPVSTPAGFFFGSARLLKSSDSPPSPQTPLSKTICQTPKRLAAREAEEGSSTRTTGSPLRLTVASKRSRLMVGYDCCAGNTEPASEESKPAVSSSPTTSRLLVTSLNANTSFSAIDSCGFGMDSLNITDMVEDSETARREKRRERNRLAAAKCRQNRQNQIDTLKARVSELKQTGSELKSDLHDLELEKSRLLDLVRDHGLTGCSGAVDMLERRSVKASLPTSQVSEFISPEAGPQGTATSSRRSILKSLPTTAPETANSESALICVKFSALYPPSLEYSQVVPNLVLSMPEVKASTATSCRSTQRVRPTTLRTSPLADASPSLQHFTSPLWRSFSPIDTPTMIKTFTAKRKIEWQQQPE